MTTFLARSYYDEPTCTGWIVGSRRCHIEINPYSLYLQLGGFSFRLSRADLLDEDEWKARL